MFHFRSMLPVLGMMTVVAALAAAPRSIEAQTFDGQNISTGYARDVLIQDLNGDDRADLVLANMTGNSVSILLGAGVAGFGARTDLAVGSGPFCLAVGDLNGDGKLDLVTGNTNSATVLLGNGIGGFGARVDYPATSVVDVGVADMTGDGRPDLVVTTTSGFSIFAQTSGGTLAAAQSTASVGTPFAMEIGDLNGDGVMDVAMITYSGSMAVRCALSNGTGGYSASTPMAVPIDARTLALGDLNGDGKLDVVTGNSSANSLTVGVGDGTGAFGTVTTYSASSAVYGLTIADVNGDGRADVCDVESGQVMVRYGTGTGALSGGPALPVDASAWRIAAGDLNGDGLMDLVIADTYTNMITVFTRSKSSFGTKTDFATGTSPRFVAVGDLNGDGRPDMALANEGTNTVSVLLGNGGGGFGAKTDFTVGATPTSVAIGDITGDGKPDLVTANNATNTISVLPGNGSGGFGAKTDYPAGSSAFSAVVGDVNGDNRLDVVCSNVAGNSVSVFLNNGAGGLGAKTDFTTGANPLRLALGYVNGDSYLDVVTANNGGNSVSVLLGTGTGSFGAKTDFATPFGPNGIALADLNGDGKLDIVTANSTAGTLSTLAGNGSGGFGAYTEYSIGGSPFTVAAGDMNGDGKTDFAVSNGGNSTVSLFLGDGNGGLVPQTSLTAGNTVRGVAVGDVNGDGRLDVVTANSGSNTASVLLNTAQTTRTTLTVSPTTALVGWPMTLTANVSIVVGSGTPADSVRFFDGVTWLGSAVVSNGVATLPVFAPFRGDRAMTAVYKGDGRFFGSFSRVTTVRVVSTAAPRVTGITDVTGDQGGQVRLLFSRSPYDYSGSGTPITGYQVYRRSIVSGSSQVRERAAAASAKDPALALAGWDYLLTVPATAEDVDQAVVPTLADSNASGFHRAVLFVRAVTASPTVFYDSPADSGYSVDNLPPVPPAPFTAAYAGGAVHLHWGANTERDLWYYKVYRGADPSFTPGPANQIASTADTGYVDAGPGGSFYKLSAVDVNGNESGYVVVQGPGGTTAVGDDASVVSFALDAVRPNPTRGSRLTLSFALPTAASAKLELLDVSGRLVVAQEVGALGAGRHTVNLAVGRLAPGLYLARLTQRTASRIRRVVVVE